MGRFFQTAPTQFIEDFIYQPPWELIQQNNMLKAQNYDTQQKTLSLIGNLPIDFWDKPDSELAKAKQDEYKKVTNSLTETLKKDPNNKEAMLQLHDISNKIYQDYTYGDLAKLRKNKENHDKFLAIADSIKDPQEREIFLKQEGLYLQPNEQGLVNNALKKQFEFMEAQPLRNLPTEFLSSDAFKSLEANMDAGENIKIGNEFITKTGYSNEELKSGIIQQAYKHWLEGENLDKGNWSRYMTELAGIKDLSDDKGQLRWDNNSYLGKSIKTVGDTYKYKKSKSTKDVNVNQVAENIRTRAFQERMQQGVPKEVALLPEAQKKVSSIILEGSAIRQGINADLEAMGKKYGLKINIHSIPQLLKWATNNNKIAFKNSLLEYQDRIQKTYKASLDPLYSMGYSKEYVDKYYTNLQKNIKTKGLNVPGILDLEESGLGTISKKISLSNLQGKTLGGYKVESAQLVQDSSSPLILSPDEKYNKIQSTVKLKISKGKDVKEVYVDYYQDSADISGRTNLNN